MSAPASHAPRGAALPCATSLLFLPKPMRRNTLLVTLVLLVSACSSTPDAPPPETSATPQRDLLAEVRAAVATHDTGFEVQPLREPAIEDLRSSAIQAQAKGDHDDALVALDQAISLSPSDPELRQLRAEAFLSKGMLDEAERAAALAYEAGPRVGSLCLRSWHTVRVARDARGTPEAAKVAEGMLQGCQVEPPPRL